MTPSHELLALWRRVETHLRRVLVLVQIDPEQRRQTQEFLAHNELGLAFQTLVAALADERAAPPASARDHLAAAAAEMELEDDPDWHRLTSGRPWGVP